MWHLKKIPKIIHFYFGGESFEYARYLSILTFVKLNPDWTVYFYYPKTISKDITWLTNEQQNKINTTNYFKKLYNLPIHLKQFNFDEISIPNISEIHKSDFLRLHLLSTVGGVWSDTDIFYLKPIYLLDENKLENASIDTGLCINPLKEINKHSIGFIFACPDNSIFQNLLIAAKQFFDPSEYQSIGTKLYSKIFPSIEHINHNNPINLDPKCIYPYDSRNIEKIYDITYTNYNLDNNIGIHWYGGHPLYSEFMRNTDGGLINLPNNLLGNLIKNYEI